MTSLFEKLAAEFDRDAVHWRAQTLTQAGDKALALAYLDARDVMDRLDSVCTPAGWRNTVTETPKGRLIATIEIKFGDEWIGKTDGAGETDVEGDKGGISDALKRAAVLWGIGRYLYRMKSVWAPCEAVERNGKKYWKAWKGSPWDQVRGSPAPKPSAEKPAPYDLELKLVEITACDTLMALKRWWKDNGGAVPETYQERIVAAIDDRTAAINTMDRSIA